MPLFGPAFSKAFNRIFHDRQIVLCSDSGARQVLVSRRRQVLAAAVIAGIAVWGGVATLGAAATGWMLFQRTEDLRDLESRHAVLAEDMARRIGWGAGIGERLDAGRSVSDRIVAQNARLIAEISALQTALREIEASRAAAVSANRALDAAVAERDRRLMAAAAERAGLERRVAARDAEIAQWRDAEASWTVEADQLRREIAARERDLAAVTADAARAAAWLRQSTRTTSVLWQHRNALLDQRTRMGAGLDLGGRALVAATGRIDALEAELRLAHARGADLWAAANRERDRNGVLAGERDRARLQLAALQDAQQELFDSLRERMEEHVDQVAAGLAFTGLDIDTLLAELEAGGESVGYGGPMLPVVPDDLPDGVAWAEAVEVVGWADRAAALRDLANALPIGQPVRDDFRLSSNFGYRRDPFTRRSSRHTGLDMAAPTGTPIYVTAPGTVIDAGRRGAYGYMVEVEHAFGLTTRYAHLSVISVAAGQQVGYGDQVGLMGSTGRSSGPHLHYEVRVRDEPRNPIGFIRAGQHVFQAN